MGIFNRLTKKKNSDTPSSSPGGSSAAHGNHSINHQTVMNPHGGISPTNPGNFSSVRSRQLESTPRYFSEGEATQLAEEAKAKRKAAQQTKRAYKALASIEMSDAVVHTSHRAYEAVSAKAELTKKQADAKLARYLHGQRASYGRLSHSLELADQQAQARIEAARSQMDQQFQDMLSKLQSTRR